MTNPPQPESVELVEKLAAIEHERWADWQKWMHRVCLRNKDGSLVLPAELVQRWERQIVTKYDDLAGSEKQSDRDQVMRYLPLIKQLLLAGVPKKRSVGTLQNNPGAKDFNAAIDEMVAYIERVFG